MSTRLLAPIAEQRDLPPGETWLCMACGTRVKVGQPHRAVLPFAHATVKPLLVEMSREELEAL